ncbi:MAG: VWA domain-containing protein, partial [Alphaproteobacteria bacterium]|nr:VWA domain-containing protein [Alphaproteobacteria bacterium]
NGGTGAADSLSQDDSNLVTQVRFEGNVVNVGAAGATITGDYGTLTIQQDGSYSYTLLPGASVGGTVVTGSTTVAMNPNSGDVAGTQTSLTKNGITVSIGPREGSSETVGVGDLKWHDVGDGPGIGIGSNGSSDNKVWPQGEKLIVDPADLASSMTFTLADVSTTNQGNPLSIRIHFEDGSSTVVKMNVPSTLPSSHMWDITIDSSSFGGKLIESAELFNKPGDKSVSFMLNNVTAEIPTTTTVPADCPEDVFTYVITDGDGDTSSATLTLDGSCPTLIVGKNVDDRTGSTTDHYIGGGEGAIVGSTAGDILVGDIGGSSMVDAKGDYNIVLILDTSGSMGSGNGSRLDKLQKAVNNLLSELNDYNGGTIKVHIVPFNTDDRTAGTFTVTSDAGLTSAISFVNNMPKDGWTNYEAGMDAAIKYYDSSAPIDGAQNITYFISDGEPNHAITNNGNVQSYTDKNDPADWAMGAIGANTGVGGDGSNEITALQARSEVIGVGISLSNNAMANINLIDSNGSGVNVQNPDDLTSTLSGLNPISQLNASGDDVITGGDGNDIIYGDNVNTDALAADKGLGTAPGAGWAVFDQLEAGSTGWTRADTIEYITTQAQRQAAGQSNDWTGTENFGADGNVRAGGDDTLNGGAGDDIIFGQNGNDTIRGGADDDYIDGGVGNDVIYGDDGDDVLYGWTGDDIISGGAGNDDLVGEAGNDTLTGGAGADTFWYLHPQPGVDTIKDFKVSEGDTLELSELLSGHYDPLQDAINDFVFTRTTGGNTVVSIDLTGSGNAANAVDITVLEGVSTTLNDLVNSNSIVTV